MTNFNIKIISDNVCPWCYIGKARLDKAISLYRRVYPSGKDDTFTISWAPFYLDPSAPVKGIPWPERAASRFGADRVPALEAKLRTIGAQEGIDFSFDGKIGNTRDSHRVIELAAAKGSETQEAVVREIMRAYFEGGGDITSWDMLVEAAGKAGLDAAETRRWLEEGGGGEAVDREAEDARLMGVSGVPHFVIQEKYQIGGAQDVQAFMEQFVAIKEEEAGRP